MKIKLPTTTISDQEKEVVIQRLQFQSNKFFTGQFLEALKIDFVENAYNIGEDMLMRMRSEVLAVETRSLTRSISYPTNWWEMFKEQYFTHEMKKRFPIKYKTIKWNIKTFATYPEWDLVLPKEKVIYKHYVTQT